MGFFGIAVLSVRCVTRYAPLAFYLRDTYLTHAKFEFFQLFAEAPRPRSTLLQDAL